MARPARREGGRDGGEWTCVVEMMLMGMPPSLARSEGGRERESITSLKGRKEGGRGGGGECGYIPVTTDLPHPPRVSMNEPRSKNPGTKAPSGPTVPASI